MKSIIVILQILAFIFLSTLNFEYLVNQADSTLLLLLAILLEILLFYTLILNLIKKLLKK